VQTSSGIEVRVNRAWRDGKEVHAEVCFTLPDTSDWSIWGANMQYAGGSTVDFGSTLLSLQEAVEGQSGLRCDDLSFSNVPPDADLTNVIITIDAIAAPPRDDEYCGIYMSKIQQTLIERGIAIQLACSDTDTGQVCRRKRRSKSSTAMNFIRSKVHGRSSSIWDSDVVRRTASRV